MRFWDFLFYASFGLVVTRSVAIAGVLLVFCYLIVPSVGGMLFSDRVGPRLAIGWVMAGAVSFLGMYFSVLLDLPTGATIVCTFGLVLILMAAPTAGNGAREGRRLEFVRGDSLRDFYAKTLAVLGLGSDCWRRGHRGLLAHGRPPAATTSPSLTRLIVPPLTQNLNQRVPAAGSGRRA